MPPGVAVVPAPDPPEISGVAALPGGFLVVGDDTSEWGRIWPKGDMWRFATPIEDPESVDVGFAPDGEGLWLVAGEDHGELVDHEGARFQLPEDFGEVCNRGVEGLAVRYVGAQPPYPAAPWEVVAMWEGGWLRQRGCDTPGYRAPKLARLRWQVGVGAPAPATVVTLVPPEPGGGQRFRAPDLVFEGDGLLVLLSSLDASDDRYEHTWLQRFDFAGQAQGEPYRLERTWGDFRHGRNWEGLDWSLDRRHLVLGFDTRKEEGFLALLRWPPVVADAAVPQ